MTFAQWGRTALGVLAGMLVVAVVAAADGAGDVVWLGAQSAAGEDMGRGLLIREEVRQGILIAARDEMGLATRDAALRDFDAASPTAINVELDVDVRKSLKVTLVAKGRPVWSGQMPLRPGPDRYDGLAESGEAWSRKQFVEALKAAGFTPAPKNAAVAGKGAEVAPEVERLLRRMNVVSQFDAARRLHAAIRAQGESAAATGALVRAYANLGALTERQWYAADRVFKARALLYAQRMRVARGKTADVFWHRAYARAMAGLYGAALADLKAATAKAKEDGSVAPPWADEIRALCAYDATALAAIAQRAPDEAPLATFLAMLQIAGSAAGAEVMEKGQAALKADPENGYVMDRVTAAAGVSAGHSLTTLGPRLFVGRTLLVTLPECAGLPAPVAARVTAIRAAPVKADVTSIAAIAEGLIAAGGDARADRGEPSWSALGRIVQETHFLHTYRRAAFLRDYLGAGDDAADVVRQNLPLVGADHPYRSFVEFFTVERRRDPARYEELLAGVRVVDPTNPVRQWLAYLKGSPKLEALHKVQYRQLYFYSDYVTRDLEELYTISGGEWRVGVAKQILAVSPKSPYGMGVWIEHEWKQRKAGAAQYEAWAPGCAHLQSVLAQRYAADGQMEDAARCFQAYLAVAKEPWVYQSLAKMHLDRGDQAGWLASLEACLRETEDYGMTHANVRVQIARGLMARGEYRQAVPYAEGAAATGAAWGMNVAGECHEGAGAFDRAIAFYRDAALAYPANAFAYWFACHRLKDAAHLTEADKMVQASLVDVKLVDRDHLAAYYWVKGDRKQAMEAFGSVDDPLMSSHLGLHLALAADATGDAALRDRALAAVIAQKRSERTREYFQALARLFVEALTSPDAKPNLTAIDDLIAKQPAAGAYLNEMTGRFLLARGLKADAVRYLRAAVKGSSTTGAEFNLAWAALVEQGLDPRALRPAVKE